MDIISLLPTIYSKFILYTLIFTRIGAMFTVFVLFRKELVTARIIVSLTTVLALIVLLNTDIAVTYDFFSLQMTIQIFLQTLIGFVTGLMVNIVFDVFMGVGQIVSTQIGLGISSLIDPRFGYVTSLSQFYIILCSLLFLFANGHLYLIKMIIDSFNTFPLFQAFIPDHLIINILNYAGVIFSGSFILSINIILILMLTNLALAIMTKFAPQFNLFSIGINMELIIGLISIYLTLNLLVSGGRTVIDQNIQFFTQQIKEIK